MTFSSTLNLSEAELRRQLGSSDATERLWAAWRLALKQGAAAAGVLEDATENEPNEGVRRHLTTVLAGLGDWPVVRTIAADDPAVPVVATALVLLARQRNPTDSSLLTALLERGDETLEQAAATVAPELVALVDGSLLALLREHESVSVRRAFVRSSVRAEAAHRRAWIPSWYRGEIDQPDPGLVVLLGQLVRKIGVRELVMLTWHIHGPPPDVASRDALIDALADAADDGLLLALYHRHRDD